ncbi:MAG: glycosyltransferase, partial [Bacteroidota bacterium]
LAEVLSQVPQLAVTLLSSDRDIKKSDLERFFHVDLSNIGYRFFQGGLHRIKHLTKGVDVFVCLSNFRRVPTSARRSVQLLQIPYGKITAASLVRKVGRGKLKESVKDLYRLQLLSYSKRKVDLVITNSHFVSEVLSRNFGIQSHVLHPPIQDFFIEGMAKKKIILSVGRFFIGLYNDKRYDILTEAFRRISRSSLSGWEYHIAGSCASDPATKGMLDSLQNQNEGFPISFHINEPYESLQRLYNGATIFWHGAGFGVDEASLPERVEHFGMTTVEAMSTGCIPVVCNKGGQKEIVQHGLNGYLWNTIDELVARTISIAHGNVHSQRDMRQNTRKRFQDFNMERFQQTATELFRPLLT